MIRFTALARISSARVSLSLLAHSQSFDDRPRTPTRHIALLHASPSPDMPLITPSCITFLPSFTNRHMPLDIRRFPVVAFLPKVSQSHECILRHLG